MKCQLGRSGCVHEDLSDTAPGIYTDLSDLSDCGVVQKQDIMVLWIVIIELWSHPRQVEALAEL